MVAIQESINSRFCSVVEIKFSFFLKGGNLPRSGSRSRSYWSFQNVFALDLGHFQYSNSK